MAVGFTSSYRRNKRKPGNRGRVFSSCRANGCDHRTGRSDPSRAKSVRWESYLGSDADSPGNPFPFLLTPSRSSEAEGGVYCLSGRIAFLSSPPQPAPRSEVTRNIEHKNRFIANELGRKKIGDKRDNRGETDWVSPRNTELESKPYSTSS